MNSYQYETKEEIFELEVPDFKMSELMQVVERIDKKGAKLGFDKIKLTTGEHIQREVEFTKLDKFSGEESSRKSNVNFIKTTIRGSIPAIKGFEFKFRLQRDQSDGPVLITYAKGDVPSEFLSGETFSCDLCKTKRNRSSILGFQSLENSEFVTIGGECARDFSTQSLQYLIELRSAIETFTVIRDEDLADSFRVHRSLYTLPEGLHACAHLIIEKGFIKASEAGSTGEEAKEMLISNSPYNQNSKISEFLSNPLSADIIELDAKLNFNLKHNFKSFLSNGSFDLSHINIIAFFAYYILGPSQQLVTDKGKGVGPSEHIGSIDESVSVKGVVTYYSTAPSAFNQRQIVCYTMIKDDSGNIFETNSSSFFPKLGQEVEFSAKIKKHRVSRNGEKINVVNFPKTIGSPFVSEFIENIQNALDKGISAVTALCLKESGKTYETDLICPPFTIDGKILSWDSYDLVHSAHLRFLNIESSVDSISMMVHMMNIEEIELLINNGYFNKVIEVYCSQTSFKKKLKLKLKYNFDQKMITGIAE